VFVLKYKGKQKRLKPIKYQPTEERKFFSDKEFIIRSNGKMKVFKISSKLQGLVVLLALGVGLWSAYSYRMYTVSDKIISYQEKKLDETRNAYVDLMSDFVSVHKNISSVMEGLGQPEKDKGDDIDEYLKKAEVIEERIRQITATEDWIDEKEMGDQSALKEAAIDRDVAIKTNEALSQKVQHLEEVIASLQEFELDILKKVEGISNKDIEKIKTSLNSINAELKKRGKYFNPLANSKKDSKGGVFVPEKLSNVDSPLLIAQAKKTFAAVDDSRYYKEALKRVPMGKPVWTYWLTSPFGTRSDPFNSKRAAHKGVDLASNRGNKVKTMAAGKVVKAGTATGYGKMVEIDHGNGFRTRYAHLNAVYVKAGQWVNAEHAVGEVGSTGRSTGPHLHYEVLYAGVNMDPMVFIKAK
jgi:murein DD-endopeptidase MepM/ murein hydrolase activator NlpD